ncbi:hypothetical protein JTB14_029409 [Gonioctena quinquepunctata]|nr:hypothetical protein JTB14_029409 [Gonioctena quinquepunctata]
MSDDDWFGGGDDDAPPPAPKPLGKKKKEEAAAAEETEPAPADDGAPPEGGEQGAEEAEEDEYLDPDKLILFKHWIRPKFLGYKYLYMYRKNYYDDVMDYLDKRSRGETRDIPHAETWGERMLRTYNNKLQQHRMYARRIREDMEMVQRTKMSGSFFHYNVKNVFDKQFSPLLH